MIQLIANKCAIYIYTVYNTLEFLLWAGWPSLMKKAQPAPFSLPFGKPCVIGGYLLSWADDSEVDEFQLLQYLGTRLRK